MFLQIHDFHSSVPQIWKLPNKYPFLDATVLTDVSLGTGNSLRALSSKGSKEDWMDWIDRIDWTKG